MAEVTQADREAWIAYEDFDGAYADKIRRGEQDTVAGLVAFALHRTEAVKPLVEALTAALERQMQAYQGSLDPLQRDGGLVWLEGWFDIGTALRSVQS